MKPHSRFALAFLLVTPPIPTALAQSGIITTSVGPVGSASLSLNTSEGGSTAASTVGSNESTQTGYATVAINSGATPYGTAVFSFKQSGVTVSEVGVPASPPTTSARVFIDFRSSINAIPARSEAGAIDINTGIAVANSGYSSAHITYTLRNISGGTISIGHGTLNPRAHFAKFIHQLDDVASDFLLPSDFQTSTWFASLEISSDQPLSIVALRLANNQRNDPLFTTTPIADLTQPLTNDVIYFPQLVDGGGYTTSIVLLNTSSRTETGTLHFIDDNGNPLITNWVGGTADSSLRYTIPAGGSARFQTDGFPGASIIGWAELIPDAGTSTPIGAGVFSYNPGNILWFESGVPATLPTKHCRISVDLSGGHNTGLAIANPADSNVEISMKVFQSDGVTEVGTSKGPLQLPANGHQGRFANEFISGLPAGFTGVLDISSPTPFAALTMRSLNNERNDFLATLFPVADMTRNAPAPMVFPQIADGGGYVMQFILIGAGGASNATLNFHDNEGNPLAVGSGEDTPPPAMDFTLSLSPKVITQQAGGDTSPINVAIVGRHGFSGSVEVSLTGLPTGTTTSPPSPFLMTADSSRTIVLQIPASVSTGDYSIRFRGTSGNLAHAATLVLTVTAAQDFALSVSPRQLVAAVGGTSIPISISIAGQHGFAGSVTLALSGLPAGATSQPASPFTITAGQTHAVTIDVPASSALGNFNVQVEAASGRLSHSARVGLILMLLKTFDDGAGSLYLESDTLTETTRVGLNKAWGGSIVEVSLNGTDYVNNDDPGRQIQTSLWDANANYSTSWGYNPIEAGDHFFQGSPLLTFDLLPNSIYTKTQPIQWAPESFGGGPGSPAPGDAYIEKWISVVPGYNRVFKVHYRITHFGSDSHADAPNELPVMYVNPIVSNLLYYAGDAPWTNDALSQFTTPSSAWFELHTPEQWGAYVDSTNTGIALYTPMQFPNSKRLNAGSTLQFTPLCPYSWDPGSTLDFDTFILVGPVDESRAAIYDLHGQQSAPSPLPPFGSLDYPATGHTLTGTVNVTGWAWALSAMASIDVFVDGGRVGSAIFGLPKDITEAIPGAPTNLGYQYAFDSTALTNGSHTIVVKATDANGRVATFRMAQVTVSN
jgi:hypothetical protein